MKKILVLVLVFVTIALAAAAAFFWVRKDELIVRPIEAAVKTSLKEITGRDISLGGVRLSLLKGIVIENIGLYSEDDKDVLLLGADEVRVRINPLRIVFGWRGYAGLIDKVSFFSPEINISAESIALARAVDIPEKDGADFTGSINFAWHKGSVLLNGRSRILDNAEGVLKLGHIKSGVWAEFDGALGEQINMSASFSDVIRFFGTVNFKDGTTKNAWIKSVADEIKSIKIFEKENSAGPADIAESIDSIMPDYMLSGLVDLSGSFKTDAGWPSGFNAVVNFSSFSAVNADSRSYLSLNGGFSINNDVIDISGMTASVLDDFVLYTLNGRISDAFKSGAIEVYCEAGNTILRKERAMVAGIPGLSSVSGEIFTSAKISGNYSDPLISANVSSSKFSTPLLDLGSIFGSVSISKDKVDLTNFEFTALSGSGKVFGIFTRDSAFGKLKIDGLNLDGLNIHSPRLRASGQISINADLYGNILSPTIKGSVFFEDLIVGMRDFGSGSGKVDAGSGNFFLECMDDIKQSKIYIKSKYDTESINLTSAKFKFDQSSYIEGFGNIELASHEVDLNIVAKDIKFEELSFLSGWAENYDGLINAELKIKGLLNDPLYDGNMRINGFANKKNYDTIRKIDCDLKIEFNKNKLSIPTLNVQDLTEGHIFIDKFSGDLKEAEIKSRFKLDNSDLSYLNALFEGDKKISGIADGILEINHKVTVEDSRDIIDNLKKGISQILTGKKSSYYDWSAKADISASSFTFAGFESERLTADIILGGGMFSINNLEAVQSSGMLKVSGSADVRYTSGEYSFGIEAKQAKYSHVAADGLINIAGSYNERETIGLVSSDSFWLNGIMAGSIMSRFRYRDSYFNVHDLKIGELARGMIGFDFSDMSDVKLKGEIASELEDIRLLKNLYPIETDISISGPSKFRINIGGSLQSPEAEFSYSLQKNRYEDYVFSSSGEGSIKGGMMNIADARLMVGDDISLRFSGTQPLKQNATISYSMRILKCDFQALAKKYSFFEALKGDLTGILELSGSLDSPFFKGRLNAQDVAYKDVQIDNWSVVFGYHDDKMIFDEMKIDYKTGSIFMEQGGLINFKDEGNAAVNVLVNIRNFVVGQLSVFGGLRLEGTASFDSGFTGEFIVRTKNLWVNQKNFESSVFGVVFGENFLKLTGAQGSEYQLNGTIEFSEYPKISIRNFELRRKNNILAELSGYLGESDLNIEGRISGLDASLISDFYNPELNVTGLMNSEFIINGEYPVPDMLANVNIENGRVLAVPFVNANCQLKIKDGILEINSFRIINQGLFLLNASGKVPLNIEGKDGKLIKDEVIIDAELEDFGHSILKSVFPSITQGSGMLALKLKVRGSKEDPKFWGYVNSSSGELTSNKYFRRLRNLNISAVLDDYTLEIKDISGNIGSGMVRLYGKVELGWMKIRDMNLVMETTTQRGIPVTIPELSINATPLFGRLTQTPSKGEPTFKLSLTGSSDEPVFGGWIKLENTYFTYPGVDTEDEEPGFFGRDLAKRMLWDLNIATGSNTWFENEYANLKVSGDLNIKGRKGSIKVNSRIESGQGSVGYLGTKFSVSRMLLEIIPGDVAIDGDFDNNVYLEGAARTTVQRYNEQLRRSMDDEIILTIPRAMIDEIKPVFSSKETPGLSSEKALLSATGYDMSNMTTQERDLLLRRSIVQIMDATLTTPIARRIARTTGIIDTVSVTHSPIDRDQRPVTPEDAAQRSDLLDAFLGTKYTVGKHFNPNILLEYSVLIDEMQNRLDLRHELSVSYSLGRSLYLRGFAEVNAREGYRSERKAILEKQWRFR